MKARGTGLTLPPNYQSVVTHAQASIAAAQTDATQISDAAEAINTKISDLNYRAVSASHCNYK